jgi:hypothetical protein
VKLEQRLKRTSEKLEDSEGKNIQLQKLIKRLQETTQLQEKTIAEFEEAAQAATKEEGTARAFEISLPQKFHDSINPRWNLKQSPPYNKVRVLMARFKSVDLPVSSEFEKLRNVWK